jgi:hypothetical protein
VYITHIPHLRFGVSTSIKVGEPCALERYYAIVIYNLKYFRSIKARRACVLTPPAHCMQMCFISSICDDDVICITSAVSHQITALWLQDLPSRSVS